jgi:adenine-specific DNA-methyltransferase
VDIPAYVLQSHLIITNSRLDLKYLTAILNSKLCHFWLATEKKQGNNLQVDNEPLYTMPIRIPNINTQKKVVSLFDQILQMKEKSANTSTYTEEEKIDDLIYEIYDLSENDIKILNDYIK